MTFGLEVQAEKSRMRKLPGKKITALRNVVGKIKAGHLNNRQQ
jgi:hypothetical protein